MFSGGRHGEEFMLARLTRQRDMLKIEVFFNTFRGHVAGYNISASGLQPEVIYCDLLFNAYLF